MSSKEQGQDHDVEEDELQDWSTVQIPRRGEKEFEPDGTRIQSSTLQSSQHAMFQALIQPRSHHIRNKLIGIWIPSMNQGLVLRMRGKFFIDIGYVRRDMVWLNGIECLYLCERGSMALYLSNPEFEAWLSHSGDVGGGFDVESRLVMLDLEFVYCLVQVDLARYRVYSHLKRLGYMILAHKTPDDQEQVEREEEEEEEKEEARIWRWPTRLGIWTYPNLHTRHFSTASYFKFTPIYKAISLHHDRISHNNHKHDDDNDNENELDIVYDVWKPQPNFSKRNPPPPDFQLVIIDTSKNQTYLTLAQIQHLQRQLLHSSSYRASDGNRSYHKSSAVESKREIRARRHAAKQATLEKSVQIRNAYFKRRDEMWKRGYDKIVLAMVDQGVMNFVELSSGNFAFSGASDAAELDAMIPSRDHALVYND
ncbi:uncharacterized protein LODBEIA_P34070 [Lodderomyces beijingensis]|uniref:tRNA-splicing endonuclease subunit Sen54 N-terminal domain-containing protein n=1 Tax=Lodderomyces beijingensis TaxID=1775926 RepID=A0ABP0ZND4_9ASCO